QRLAELIAARRTSITEAAQAASSPAFASPAAADRSLRGVGLERAVAPGGWIRRELAWNADSTFAVKQYSRAQDRGALWVIRELIDGVEVAGAHLVIQSDAQWQLARVRGQRLASVTPTRRGAGAWDSRRRSELPPGTKRVWWAMGAELRASWQYVEPLRWEDGHPRQDEIIVDAMSGEQLARWSVLDEGQYPIRG